MNNGIKVDIIIPTYQPGPEFEKTLRGLASQVDKINSLSVVNTEEKYWDRHFEEVYPGLKVKHIKKEQFNHGRTRFEAARESDGDILVFMTQDAIPANSELISKLIAPIVSKTAAVSFARQLPHKNADTIERLSRFHNYPETSKIKTSADLEEMGVKTFFCSNVCAAYDREIYEKLGGFIHPLEFNEDMLFASKVILNGFAVSYTADALVYHSHNFSGKEQYKRNYLVGRTQAQFPEIFEKYPSEGAGIKLVKSTAKELLKEKKPLLIFKLVWISGCKYLGYRAGKKSVRK